MIGVEFDLYLLAAVLEHPGGAARPAVGRRARLVASWRRAVVPAALLNRLVGHAAAAARATRLHLRIAGRGGARRRCAPGGRRTTGVPPASHAGARRASVPAASRSSALAPDEAARWFAAALAAAPRPDLSDRGPLRPAHPAGRGAAAGRRRRVPAHAAGGRGARAGRSATPTCSPRAVLANTGGSRARRAGRRGACRELESALDLLGDADPLRRARLLSQLQFELTFVAPRGAPPAERRGPPRPGTSTRTLAHVLWARHAVLWTPELLDEHRVNAAELAAVAAARVIPVPFWAACDAS